MRAALALILVAAPAAAEEPVTAAEFEAMVEGRTLTYGAPGQPPYGVEHYFPNRRVTWAFLGSDECLEGTWRAEGPPDSPAICFDYDAEVETQCWRFWRDGDALRADFLGADADGTVGGLILYELVEDDRGLVCGGVGV